MVPFCISIITRHINLGYPKKDHDFDNHPFENIGSICRTRLTKRRLLPVRGEAVFKLRWILKILHDPKLLLPGEFWSYSTVKPCLYQQ